LYILQKIKQNIASENDSFFWNKKYSIWIVL